MAARNLTVTVGSIPPILRSGLPVICRWRGCYKDADKKTGLCIEHYDFRRKKLKEKAINAFEAAKVSTIKLQNAKIKHRNEAPLRKKREKLRNNRNMALRRSKKLLATPKWINVDLVNNIYKKALEKTDEIGASYHVDHIVPLRSKIVCGLHWEGNLQILSREKNFSKSNHWWPDMP